MASRGRHACAALPPRLAFQSGVSFTSASLRTVMDLAWVFSRSRSIAPPCPEPIHHIRTPLSEVGLLQDNQRSRPRGGKRSMCFRLNTPTDRSLPSTLKRTASPSLVLRRRAT